ncbi:MAG: hypothetical protein ACI88H_003103, partial [Cocleimonas sp.]
MYNIAYKSPPVQTGHILYKLNRRHSLHIIINIGIGGIRYAL